MFKKVILALIILSCLSISPAAEAGRPAPVTPPEGSYCSECGMYIRGEGTRFTSEVIFKGGKAVYFCDLGDLFIYFEVLKKKQDVAAIYVRDYLSGAWLDGRAGFYLSGTKVVTPMRFGILAFRDRPSAEGFKRQNGGDRVYTFDEVIRSRVYRR